MVPQLLRGIGSETAPVRFCEPGQYRRHSLALRQSDRHEQAGIAALNEQRHLFVVRGYDLAQLLDALHRSAVDGEHHVARLYAGIGRVTTRVLDQQASRHTGLFAFLRIERTDGQTQFPLSVRSSR